MTVPGRVDTEEIEGRHRRVRIWETDWPHQLGKNESGVSIEHGHVDSLPRHSRVLVALPGQKRPERSRNCRHTRCLVSDHGAEHLRFAPGPLGGHHPRQALDHMIVGGQRRIGAVGTEPADRYVDQARVDSAQLRVAYSQPIHHVRAKILHHDIALGRQSDHDFTTRFTLQIQSDAPLVAIELTEETRKARVEGSAG